MNTPLRVLRVAQRGSTSVPLTRFLAVLVCVTAGIGAAAHRCIHDHVAHQRRLRDGDKPSAPAVQSYEHHGRRLQSSTWAPLRIVPIYSNLTEDSQMTAERAAFITNVLMPYTVVRWAEMLRVQPVQGPLFASRKCTGFYESVTPAACGRAEPATCAYSSTDGVNQPISDAYIGSMMLMDENGGNVSLPALGPGLANADLAIFVTAYSAGCSSGTLAFATTCQRDQFDRPTWGAVNFCPNALNLAPGLLADAQATALHEVGHVLGWDSDSFLLFRNSDAARTPQTPRNPLYPSRAADAFRRTVTCRGQTTTLSVPGTATLNFFATPGARVPCQSDNPVAANCSARIVGNASALAAQAYFSCPNVQGIELENQDTGGCSLPASHLEQRLFNDELMGPLSAGGTRTTAITLAVLADSGWYMANYDATDRAIRGSLFGYLQGCPFALGPCIQTSPQGSLVGAGSPPHFLTESADAVCSVNRLGVTTATVSQTLTIPAQFQYWADAPNRGGTGAQQYDFCPAIGVAPASTCEATLPSTYQRELRDFAGASIGRDTRCFEASLSRGTNSVLPGARCYAMTCQSQDTLIIRIAPATDSSDAPNEVLCTAGEANVQKTVPGFTGTITCPIVSTLCSLGDIVRPAGAMSSSPAPSPVAVPCPNGGVRNARNVCTYTTARPRILGLPTTLMEGSTATINFNMDSAPTVETAVRFIVFPGSQNETVAAFSARFVGFVPEQTSTVSRVVFSATDTAFSPVFAFNDTNFDVPRNVSARFLPDRIATVGELATGCVIFGTVAGLQQLGQASDAARALQFTCVELQLVDSLTAGIAARGAKVLASTPDPSEETLATLAAANSSLSPFVEGYSYVVTIQLTSATVGDARVAVVSDSSDVVVDNPVATMLAGTDASGSLRTARFLVHAVAANTSSTDISRIATLTASATGGALDRAYAGGVTTSIRVVVVGSSVQPRDLQSSTAPSVSVITNGGSVIMQEGQPINITVRVGGSIQGGTTFSVEGDRDLSVSHRSLTFGPGYPSEYNVTAFVPNARIDRGVDFARSISVALNASAPYDAQYAAVEAVRTNAIVTSSNRARIVPLDILPTFLEEGASASVRLQLATMPITPVTVTVSAPQGFCATPLASNATIEGSLTFSAPNFTTSCSLDSDCTAGRICTGQTYATKLAICIADCNSTAPVQQLYFTPDNWNISQTVTVLARHDGIFEGGAHASRVLVDCSGEPSYGVLPTVTVPITIGDIDVPPAVQLLSDDGVSQLSTEPVYKGDPSGIGFVVQISSAPLASVDVLLSFDDAQLTLYPAYYTFSPSSGRISEPIQLIVNDDYIFRGSLDPISGASDPKYAIPPVRVTLQSADPAFNGLTVLLSRQAVDYMTPEVVVLPYGATYYDPDTDAGLITYKDINAVSAGASVSEPVQDMEVLKDGDYNCLQLCGGDAPGRNSCPLNCVSAPNVTSIAVEGSDAGAAYVMVYLMSQPRNPVMIELIELPDGRSRGSRRFNDSCVSAVAPQGSLRFATDSNGVAGRLVIAPEKWFSTFFVPLVALATYAPDAPATARFQVRITSNDAVYANTSAADVPIAISNASYASVPRLASATLSDDRSMLSISVDSAAGFLDAGTEEATFDCGNIFRILAAGTRAADIGAGPSVCGAPLLASTASQLDITRAALGEGAYCYTSDPTTIVAVLGCPASLLPGMGMYVLPSRVRASAVGLASVAGLLNITQSRDAAPLAPPFVFLENTINNGNGLTRISLCDGDVYTVSADAGCAAVSQWQWSVVNMSVVDISGAETPLLPSNPSWQRLQAALTAAATSSQPNVVLLGLGSIPRGTKATIEALATGVTGLQGSRSATIFSALTSLPNVILPDRFTFLRSSGGPVVARVRTAACSQNTTLNATFYWYQLSGPALPTKMTNLGDPLTADAAPFLAAARSSGLTGTWVMGTTSTLMLPPGLEAGVYTFAFVTIPNDDFTSFVPSTTAVTIEQDAFTAYIEGGAIRTIPRNTAFVVSAINSGPPAPLRNTSLMSFAWQLYGHIDAIQYSGPTVNIAGLDTGTYILYLTVQQGDASAYYQQRLIVDPSTDLVAAVNITSDATFPLGPEVDGGRTFTLVPSASHLGHRYSDANFTYVWSQPRDVLYGPALPAGTLPALVLAASNASVSIDPRTCSAGTYSLCVTATAINASEVTGTACYDFRIAATPTVGAINVDLAPNTNNTVVISTRIKAASSVSFGYLPMQRITELAISMNTSFEVALDYATQNGIGVQNVLESFDGIAKSLATGLLPGGSMYVFVTAISRTNAVMGANRMISVPAAPVDLDATAVALNRSAEDPIATAALITNLAESIFASFENDTQITANTSRLLQTSRSSRALELMLRAAEEAQRRRQSSQAQAAMRAALAAASRLAPRAPIFMLRQLQDESVSSASDRVLQSTPQRNALTIGLSLALTQLQALRPGTVSRASQIAPALSSFMNYVLPSQGGSAMVTAVSTLRTAMFSAMANSTDAVVRTTSAGVVGIVQGSDLKAVALNMSGNVSVQPLIKPASGGSIRLSGWMPSGGVTLRPRASQSSATSVIPLIEVTLTQTGGAASSAALSTRTNAAARIGAVARPAVQVRAPVPASSRALFRISTALLSGRCSASVRYEAAVSSSLTAPAIRNGVVATCNATTGLIDIVSRTNGFYAVTAYSASRLLQAAASIPNTILVTANTTSLTEGGSRSVAHVSVRLSSAPDADVVVAVSLPDGVCVDPKDGQPSTQVPTTCSTTSVPSTCPAREVCSARLAVASTSQLRFTPQNWAILQNFTVTAVQDFLFERRVLQITTLRFTPSSNDTLYDSIGLCADPPSCTRIVGANAGATVAFTIADADAVGVVPLTGWAALNGTQFRKGVTTAQVQVRLASRPYANVNLTVGSSAPSRITAVSTTGAARFVFTPSNWAVPQTATFSAVANSIVDGDVSVSAGVMFTASDDTDYGSLSTSSLPNVRVVAVDTNVPGVSLSEASRAYISEADTTEAVVFNLGLTAAPVTQVVVNVTYSGAGLAFALNTPPASLVLTDATPLQLTFRPRGADRIRTGVRVVTMRMNFTSPDPLFSRLPPLTRTFLLLDPDAPGFTPTLPIGTTLTRRVAGGRRTNSTVGFAIVLNTPANGTVTVRLDAVSTVGSPYPSAYAVSPATFQCTAQACRVPARLTVVPQPSAINVSYPSNVAQAQAIRVSVQSSTDAAYAAVPALTIPLPLIDTLLPGIVIDSSAANTSGIIRVSLASQPATFVVLTVESASTQGSPAVLNFTASTWAAPMTVTLRPLLVPAQASVAFVLVRAIAGDYDSSVFASVLVRLAGASPSPSPPAASRSPAAGTPAAGTSAGSSASPSTPAVQATARVSVRFSGLNATLALRIDVQDSMRRAFATASGGSVQATDVRITNITDAVTGQVLFSAARRLQTAGVIVAFTVALRTPAAVSTVQSLSSSPTATTAFASAIVSAVASDPVLPPAVSNVFATSVTASVTQVTQTGSLGGTSAGSDSGLSRDAQLGIGLGVGLGAAAFIVIVGVILLMRSESAASAVKAGTTGSTAVAGPQIAGSNPGFNPGGKLAVTA